MSRELVKWIMLYLQKSMLCNQTGWKYCTKYATLKEARQTIKCVYYFVFTEVVFTMYLSRKWLV